MSLAMSLLQCINVVVILKLVNGHYPRFLTLVLNFFVGIVGDDLQFCSEVLSFR